jgi:beta-lactamase superfamily II metal-dependent hydrolase
MSTYIHIINVGQGNMNLVICDNGAVILYDCNITDDNRNSVLSYLRRIMPKRSIDVFVNSHRDCDHMRNVREIHNIYPIQEVWDSGQFGTSPQDPVYRAYMEFRRSLPNGTPQAGNVWNAGNSVITCLNGLRDGTFDANTQSIVLRINHAGSSIILTGDSDAVAWRTRIMPMSERVPISASLLVASHHGSITFFDDPSDQRHYYTSHIRSINPAMTFISVGRNVHGHPDPKALEMYNQYSRGADNGQKVYRTDQQGNIAIELKGNGAWSASPNQ